MRLSHLQLGIMILTLRQVLIPGQRQPRSHLVQHVQLWAEDHQENQSSCVSHQLVKISSRYPVDIQFSSTPRRSSSGYIFFKRCFADSKIGKTTHCCGVVQVARLVVWSQPKHKCWRLSSYVIVMITENMITENVLTYCCFFCALVWPICFETRARM